MVTQYLVTKTERLEILVEAATEQEALEQVRDLDLTDWLYTSCTNIEIKEQ